MYQFSLASFVKQFRKALNSKPSASSMDEKLNLLTDTLIKLVFFEVGRSLFKHDRLTYGLHFVHGTFPEMFGDNEWEFFIGTNVITGESNQALPSWASPDRKQIYSIFASSFPQLNHACAFNSSEWNAWANSDSCEVDFPGSVKFNVSAF